MKLRNIFIIFLFFLFSCSKRYQKEQKPEDFIPNNHTSIIKINDSFNFNKLYQNQFLNNKLNLKESSTLLNLIITNEPVFLSSTEDEMFLVTKYYDSLIKLDSTSTTKNNGLSNKGISKTIIDKDTIYHRKIDNVFIASKNLELVTSAVNNSSDDLKTFLATTNNEAHTSLILKNSKSPLFFINSTKDSLKFEAIDINTNAKGISFNGIIKSVDSSFILNAFKNTVPQKFQLSNIIPENTKTIKRIAFDDYGVFSKNLKAINRIENDSTSNLLKLTNEIAQIENEQNKAIAINFLDAEVIDTEIDINSINETYKNVSIFNFSQPDFFKKKLSPFISLNNVEFGFVFQNFVVLSSSKDFLKQIITNKLNNNSLADSKKFKNISRDIATNSSYIIYKNENGFKDYFGKNPENYNTNIVQYIYDQDFAHINGVYSRYNKRASQNSVSEDFSFKLTNSILVGPQTVKNYTTGGGDIVLQDDKNMLYQISNSGRIIWKKKIDGKVLGKIEQIDIYKNGRLQIAFATKNKLYVLDRNGKDVAPFPLKFNDAITQPLSVFDYDKRKNYRLLITQQNQLLMYDAKGNRVKGFNFKKTNNTITSQPKHFRINSKDYIVFSQGKKLEILNRQGKERIKVNETINFSDSEIFNYKNSFATKTASGQFLQVDTKGKLKLVNQNLASDSKVTASSKTLVSLTENKLRINNKTSDLDFGNYTSPQLFYLNDKIYVTTTDLQTNKVFVFDSQAKLLENFPIYGTSSATITKLNKSKDVFVITQSDNQSVIVYKIN
ncbi:hypothetical protein ACFQ1Q_02465 [Winogradskyella litorisediminis]|uniref:Uncharacterized protein n=1 Tax=Winogradskyella litorisediminis TaxID=1156618 RepID=A0ABW3N792_9FLAO